VTSKSTEAFPIKKGIRHGCPLAPYLFLIVGEFLNSKIKKKVQQGRIRGIDLLGALESQTIAQFANDTLLTKRKEEPYVRATVHTLNQFSQASGLIINETKSIA
jgi:hypothetical protein